MGKIDEAPLELAEAIQLFFPQTEWNNAAAISELESAWSAFAENNTTDNEHPCGTVVGSQAGVAISAERSIGWFQINACNLPSDWHAAHLFNTRHNVGTAHMMWSTRGWSPWFFSAQKLGLL